MEKLMSDSIEKNINLFKEQITLFMKKATYKPLRRKQLIAALSIAKEQHHSFRKALKALNSSRFLKVSHGEYMLRETE
jgi:exoribonuclease R